MNKKLLSFIFILPMFLVIFYNTAFSKKDGAEAGRTGAPGENSCGSGTTGCHFKPAADCGSLIGQLLALNTDIELTANGNVIDANFDYTPETDYTMEFKILNPSANGGFSLTSLNTTDQYVGTLTTTDVNASVITNLAGDISYVGHVVSLATQQWSFSWKAPAAGTGNVTFYASANKANGSVQGAPINSCGDKIVPYKITIEEYIPTGDTTAIKTIELYENVRITNNPISNNLINIKTVVKTPKRYFVSVYDLSGKKVVSQENYFHIGLKTIEIPLTQKGVFIVNVSTDDNETANYKILNK